jgi:glycosyltransferase involved in cell wall biosynthesis
MRKNFLAILRGQWKQPQNLVPFGSLQAAYLILREIASSGRYQNIDLYDDEVSFSDQDLDRDVIYRNYDASFLSQNKQTYNAIYVSVDPMRRVSHALRPINDYAPIISDVGTSHFDSQWQNYFIARTSHLLRPTDGIIFKSSRTQALFKTIWNDWNQMYTAIPFPESTVIMNGIDATENQRDDILRNETRNFLGLKQTDVVFLAFSRLAPSTKIDYEALIVLWKKIVNEYPNAILLLTGSIVTHPNHMDFPYQLRTLSRELGIANNVIVVGNPYDIWPNAKTNLMSAADVFIHTTKGIEETSSLVVLEAMAHELPVIVSDWAGFSEIVKQHIHGFVIDTYSSEVLPVLKQMYSSELSSNYNGKLESHVVVSPTQIINYVSYLICNEQSRVIMGKNSRREICSNYAISNVVRMRLDFFDSLAIKARKEWGKLKEFYSKPIPLVNTGFIIKELAAKEVTKSTRFRIADASMLIFIPEVTDQNFYEISQNILTTLVENGILSAADLAELVYQSRLPKTDIDFVWPYFSFILIRLLSFLVIDISN